MGLFGPTVRDFSKSKEGRRCLETLFRYDALPNPKLAQITKNSDFAKDVLGRAFEYLLQLLIERQNSSFEFEVPFKRRFGDSRSKEAREVKRYIESGEATDKLLECLVSLGKERQKTFQLVRSKSKTDVRDALKIELRRIHELAAVLKWVVKDSFYRGWLTDGRVVTAEVDLIIDASLIEVKATEDSHKHDEHLSQLFSYFLLSQAPMRRLGAFVIDELGIYYARHGVMVKQNVPEIVRFPLNRVTRIAFDFAVEFSRWRTRRMIQREDKNYAMMEVIRELYPRPAWVSKILERRQEDFYNRTRLLPRKIVLPKDFLLRNC